MRGFALGYTGKHVPSKAFPFMFLRMYAGIFASLLLALLIGYNYYQYSNKQRLVDYQSQRLSPTLQLASENATRLSNEHKKLQYLDLVSRLLGAELSMLRTPVPLPARQLKTLQSGQPTYIITNNGATQWLLPVGDQQLAKLSFHELNEQKYRGMASLLVAELARLQWPNTTSELQRYSDVPLQLQNTLSLGLDSQQKQRLDRGSIVIRYDDKQHSELVVYTPTRNGQVLMMGPITRFNPLPWSLFMQLIVIVVVVITAVTTAMVYLLQQRFNQLMRAVDQFGRGKLNTRVNITGRDSLARLGQRIDTMAAEIERLLDNQQHLLQAVSHELRTPLAKMKFRLQLLEDKQTSDTPQVEALRKDVHQLEGLVNEVMTYQRSGAANTLNRLSVDLSVLAKDALAAHKETAPAVRFSLKIEHSAAIEADPSAIERLLNNLISNAIKHCQQRVHLAVKFSVKGNPLLMVEDDGAGIPEQERGKVFDAFYRVDASRNKTTGGYGLGLAIVKRIADNHHAKVVIGKSESLGGTAFSVEFETQ